MIIQCVDCDSLCGVDSVFNGATDMSWPLPVGHRYIVTVFAVDGNGIAVEEYRFTETFTVPGNIMIHFAHWQKILWSYKSAYTHTCMYCMHTRIPNAYRSSSLDL